MTLSVPSAFAAAISALMPPPAAAVDSVDQLTAPEPDDELGDELEHPAASSATAANPASANLCGDLTSTS